MSTTATPAQTPLTPRRRWSVLVVCATAMFLVGLDTTIVNLALPRIGQDLGTSTRGLEWVVDAYTVVFASLLITSGALADRWGRRRVLRVGLVAFGAASLLGAAAPGVGLLVVARALQGVGASMLSPVALAIVVGAMPDLKERARAVGVWASVFGLSMAAGPVVAVRCSPPSAGDRCSGSAHPWSSRRSCWWRTSSRSRTADGPGPSTVPVSSCWSPWSPSRSGS